MVAYCARVLNNDEIVKIGSKQSMCGPETTSPLTHTA
jgi:hypothetical protein